MEKLTNKQEEVLKYVKNYIAKYNYPPAIREIGKALGLTSPATIHTHLSSLEEKGYIKKSNTKYRSLELLVKNEYINDKIIDVPLLGKVTAGNPIEAIETPNEYFSLPAYLIPTKEEIFTLKVSGDSMINAGIFDNDIVIVKRQNTANNGDIVVAMNEENEVTLKRFYKEKNHIRLQPENDTMSPIILEECTILGKAIGLYRKF
ncbi:MAG TPA: transcriptional repressor LexA [Bacilli bacterium]|nr:transcriptional repressor LexA [Bacilli bacterium]